MTTKGQEPNEYTVGIRFNLRQFYDKFTTFQRLFVTGYNELHEKFGNNHQKIRLHNDL